MNEQVRSEAVEVLRRTMAGPFSDAGVDGYARALVELQQLQPVTEAETRAAGDLTLTMAEASDDWQRRQATLMAHLAREAPGLTVNDAIRALDSDQLETATQIMNGEVSFHEMARRWEREDS